jgi:hypothetical protein
MEPQTASSHDTSLEYLEVDLGTPEGFQVTRGGSSVSVEGLCPRCSGRTHSTFRIASPDRKPRSRGLLDRFRRGRRESDESGNGDAEDTEQATVFCECGAVHAKRPDDATDAGCGAYWIVTL